MGNNTVLTESSEALSSVGVPHCRLVILGTREDQVAILVVFHSSDGSLVSLQQYWLLL